MSKNTNTESPEVVELSDLNIAKALATISGEEQEKLNKMCKDHKDFKIAVGSKEYSLHTIISFVLQSAHENQPDGLKGLTVLLEAGIGDHPVFLKERPLNRAIYGGDENVVSLLKDDATFYAAILKDERHLSEGNGFPALNKLYKAIMTDNLEMFDEVSSSELFDTEFTLNPAQVAWAVHSPISIPLTQKYQEELPYKLLECFEELRGQKELTEELKDKVKNQVVGILERVCHDEQMKKKMPEAAKYMVTEAASLAGVTVSWKDRIMEIIKSCLSKLGLFPSFKLAQDQMKDQDLRAALKNMRVEQDNSPRRAPSPSPTRSQSEPGRVK